MAERHQRFSIGIQGIGAMADDYRYYNGRLARHHRYRIVGDLH